MKALRELGEDCLGFLSLLWWCVCALGYGLLCVVIYLVDWLTEAVERVRSRR